jgi:hypothetical protein
MLPDVLATTQFILFLCLQQHGSSRFASSTSVVKQSSGGLFGWLLGAKPTQLPTLDVPLPGITLPPALPDFVEPAKTKVTTLPNGIKIASETSMVLLSVCRCFTVFAIFYICMEVTYMDLSAESSCNSGIVY